MRYNTINMESGDGKYMWFYEWATSGSWDQREEEMRKKKERENCSKGEVGGRKKGGEEN